MKIKSFGIYINRYFVPPFELSAGEMVVINLFGGGHYYPTANPLIDIFTGKYPYSNVTVHEPLTPVKLVKEPKIKSLFNPSTVEKYIQQNDIDANTIIDNLYPSGLIRPDTRIKDIHSAHIKLFSLYCTIPNATGIVFDFGGLLPTEGQLAFQGLKGFVGRGGAALVIDRFDEFKNDCTNYLELQRGTNETGGPLR